jgi:protein-S-isoprenylcysteine O-methyltransferase Ste14
VIVWGFVSLGDALTPFPRPRDGATLHRQGVYRFMRHPIYSGVLLAGLGWSGWWLSGAGLLAVLALAIFFDRKAAYEEAWLRKKYPGYADYARRVKKFIPGVY